jgi:cyclopropane fatty-acyl-phospholipid synthase-like methyltransferase
MSDAELGAFLRGLHAGAIATGEQLARQFGLDRARTLLDVGGGSGGVAIAACQVCPELSATIIELPRVAPFARSCVEEANLSSRIQLAVADVLEQPPEGQFDAAVLRHFIQIMGPESAQRALKNVGGAIRPGGDLFIVGHVVEDNRVSPGPAVGQSLVFLTLYDQGQAYTEKEYHTWLTAVGFSDIRVSYCVASGGASIIAAHKAE